MRKITLGGCEVKQRFRSRTWRCLRKCEPQTTSREGNVVFRICFRDPGAIIFKSITRLRKPSTLFFLKKPNEASFQSFIKYSVREVKKDSDMRADFYAAISRCTYTSHDFTNQFAFPFFELSALA